MGWAVRGSNPGTGEIFCTRPDRPRNPTQPPIQCVTGHSRGVKQLLPGVNHPPSSSAEVKEGVGVNFPMYGFMTGYSVNFTLTFTLEIPHLKKFITM
jgi:hypothetical protein